MDYKLTVNDNGDVEVVMKAGSSFVLTSMPEGKAKGIIEASGKIEKSNERDGFEICVNDGEYYFAGKFTSAKAEKPVKADRVAKEEADEPKKAVKKTTAKKTTTAKKKA